MADYDYAPFDRRGLMRSYACMRRVHTVHLSSDSCRVVSHHRTEDRIMMATARRKYTNRFFHFFISSLRCVALRCVALRCARCSDIFPILRNISKINDQNKTLPTDFSMLTKRFKINCNLRVKVSGFLTRTADKVA